MHRVRLASRAFLPLNRQGEAESPYSLISQSKADDRVGKWIDSTANSQSGRIAFIDWPGGVSRMGMR
jgi:hypothetical protein